MMGFRDIIGQDSIISTLTGVVKSGKAAHAYIFDGEKGMGKKTLAAVFARALQCETPFDEREGAEPCGHCHSCKCAESGSHPDIITLVPEKTSSIGVSDIRSQVVNDVAIKPYYSPRKIYIIPDANLMTEEAENALLKTLEEPPSYAVIIILSDNKDRLLPTIVSRAVCFQMRAVDNNEVRSFLERKNPELTDTSAVISFARGNLGRAVQLSESEEFKLLFEKLRRIVTGVRDMNDTGISLAAAEAAGKKEEGDDVLSFLLLWFRDVLFLKAGGSEERLIFFNEERELARAAAYYSFERINRIIEEIKTARSRLRSNVNPENTFELLFMNMR